MVVSPISARGFVFIQIFDLQVPATRCARAALAVQAHGTPLVHKSRVDGNAHLWGASVSNSLRASGALQSRRMERHLRIESRVDGNAHLWGASVSNSLRASGACSPGAWNATRS